MHRVAVARLVAAAAFLFPGLASARAYSLDYRGALALARDHAPAVLAAQWDRWPFPALPPDAPGMPRGYIVEAGKP